jgi:hypothetical protein
VFPQALQRVVPDYQRAVREELESPLLPTTINDLSRPLQKSRTSCPVGVHPSRTGSAVSIPMPVPLARQPRRPTRTGTNDAETYSDADPCVWYRTRTAPLYGIEWIKNLILGRTWPDDLETR